MANHVKRKLNDVISFVGIYKNNLFTSKWLAHLSMPLNRTGRKYTVGIVVTLS